MKPRPKGAAPGKPAPPPPPEPVFTENLAGPNSALARKRRPYLESVMDDDRLRRKRKLSHRARVAIYIACAAAVIVVFLALFMAFGQPAQETITKDEPALVELEQGADRDSDPGPGPEAD